VFGIDGLDRSDIEPGHVMEKNKVHSNWNMHCHNI
jgi:hypothetical protein